MPRLSLFVLGLLVGCGAAPEEQVNVSAQRAPVMGAVRYGADCTATHRSFLDKAMRYGRIAAASSAFFECVDTAVRTGIPSSSLGPYRPCNGDPYQGSDPFTQVAAAVSAMRSTVDVTIHCSGGGSGIASASVGAYGSLSPEVVNFSSWLTTYSDPAVMSWPICDGTNLPNCRLSGEPWPWSRAADAIWHEASHQQGYTHGGNSPAAARSACGYASDPQWDYQNNTMPYIIGVCLDQVLVRSAVRCGSPFATAEGLRVITGFESWTCAEIKDPHQASVTWQYVGFPWAAAKIAACSGGRLYALNTDGSLYVNHAGGADSGWSYVTVLPWTQQITCANEQLYAFNNDRTLWRNVGSDTAVSWAYVGRPGGASQIAGSLIHYFFGSAPVFYALNDDHTLWRSDSGGDGTWTYVGRPTAVARLAAGANFLDARPFALAEDKRLWLNSGDGCDEYWHHIGTPADTVEISAGNMDTLYALNANHTLWRGTVNNAGYLVPTAFGTPRRCNGTTLVP